MAGYSGKPLAAKLGIKSAMTLYFVNPPKTYRAMLRPLPDGVREVRAGVKDVEFIHLFAKSTKELAAALPGLKGALAANGMLWVSWPKKASGVATDLTEKEVRALGLEAGLVDVKVCAIDDTWSGLKFVYRLKDRKR